jgi:branched-chain amino acid transport system permease protein
LLAGLPFAVAVGGALLTGVLVAVASERVAFRPVREADPAAQLVTSLAVATILQSMVMATVNSRSQSVATPAALGEATEVAGIAVPNLELLTLGLTATVLAGLIWLIYRTRAGLEMRAAAENFEMARLLGVRADRVVVLAFAISGLLAAMAGVLLVAQTGQVSPTMGLTPVVVGFVAVTIGGFGRISGAVMGGVVLGALSSLLGAYLPDGLAPFRDAFVFSVPVVILVFRPEGLLAPRDPRARV